MGKYLINCVDKGGPKTFSSGAFDFRGTFVSIVLFRGAYVWIKFRYSAPTSVRKRKVPPPDTVTGVQFADASDLKGVYRRVVKDKSSGAITGCKYEPRFTPPREEADDGTTRRFNRLSLGEYLTPDEAKIVLQIARFYYNKDQGCVELGDGHSKYVIPPMNEQERGLAGEEKRKWVTIKAKQVYLGIQKLNLEQLSGGNRTDARSSHDSNIGASEIPSVASANALGAPSCPAPWTPCDVVGALVVPSCPASLLPDDVVDDYCETFSDFSDMIGELLCPDSPNSVPQQSSLNCEMHHLGFDQILGGPSSPQADGVTQGIQGSIDAHLSPRVDFQQGWDVFGTSGSDFFAKLSDPVLQQVVHHQKQLLEVSTLRILALEHQQFVSQIQISGLQDEIECLRQENERLRTMLQRFANSQMAA